MDNFLFYPGNCADDDRFKLNIIRDKPIQNKTLNSQFKEINKSGPKVPVAFYKASKSEKKRHLTRRGQKKVFPKLLETEKQRKNDEFKSTKQ